MAEHNADRWLAGVPLVHGVYYLVGGMWPLIGIRSFLAVTGPKTDVWLVKTVGLLMAVTGAVVGSASLRRSVTPEVTGLAIGSSAAFVTVDVVYAARGRISRVYLLDAASHVLLIAAWLIAIKRR